MRFDQWMFIARFTNKHPLSHSGTALASAGAAFSALHILDMPPSTEAQIPIPLFQGLPKRDGVSAKRSSYG
jgi:hypothetical protein